MRPGIIPEIIAVKLIKTIQYSLNIPVMVVNPLFRIYYKFPVLVVRQAKYKRLQLPALLVHPVCLKVVTAIKLVNPQQKAIRQHHLFTVL